MVAVCAPSARLAAQTATSNLPVQEYWVTDGKVYAARDEGNTLYFGGEFRVVAPPNGSFVPVDPSGTPLAGFARVDDGAVHAVVDDGAGGWIIGGSFTRVAGQVRQRLAQIRADGRLGAWNPGADGDVMALARWGRTVYVGGSFTNLGGAGRTGLGAVSLLGNAALAWNPNATGQVRTLALDPSSKTLFLGGTFTQVQSTTRCSAAAVDADPSGGALRTWDPNVRVGASCGAANVHALQLVGSDVVIAGSFDNLNGTGRSNLGRVSNTTGTPTPWDPVAVGSGVYALAVDGAGHLYAGGLFSQVASQPRTNLAAFDAAGVLDPSWTPDPPSVVKALAWDGSRVYVGGSFDTIAGTGRQYAAAFSLASWPPALDAGWIPNPAGPPSAFVASHGVLGVGGSFGGLGGQERLNAAALDVNTGSLKAWNPAIRRAGSPARVHALAVAPSPGPIYLGGEFSSVGATPIAALAAVDRNTGALFAGFSGPALSGTDIVLALGHDNNTPLGSSALYVGGAFTSVAGCLPGPTSCANIYKVNGATGALDNTFSPAARADGPVKALWVSPTIVDVGGDFGNIGGQPRAAAASLGPTSGLALGLDPSASGGSPTSIKSIERIGADTYMVGDFAQLSGQPRPNAGAAFYLTSTLIRNWSPAPGGVTRALEAGIAGDVYIGGDFTTPQPRLARVDPVNGNLVGGWSPTPDGPVRVLAHGTTRITVGGDFATISGELRPGLAAFCEGFAPPSDLTASPIGFNHIRLTWTAPGVTYYRVFRRRTGINVFEALPTLVGPTVAGSVTYDDYAAEGGVNYTYTVRVEQGGPPGGPCRSNASNQANATTAGACGLAPDFEGVGTAEWIPDAAETFCAVKIEWQAATAPCSGGISYRLYRSTSAGFFPDETNRLATPPGLSYKDDADIVGGATYYYIARATDSSNGEEDQNLVRARVDVPAGCGGKPTAPSKVPVATTRAKTDTGSSNEITWLTPNTGSGPDFCVRLCPGTPIGPACSFLYESCNDAPGSRLSFTDTSAAAGATQYYALFRRHVPSASYTSVYLTGRPDSSTPDEAWAFKTGAAALVTPSIYPGVAYATVSNDRWVHAMSTGAAGGSWPSSPSTWVPRAMNGPTQGGPAFLPATAALGGNPGLLVASTDGRVYAFNAATGAPIWTSLPLAPSILARPSAMFTEASPSAVGDFVFVGTRDSIGPNRLDVLSLGGGTLAAQFPKVADVPGGTGPIHAPALVDYAGKRVIFGSRRRSGSSTNTLWCLSLDPVIGEPCAGWPSDGGVDVGEIDVALSLRNGRVFFATTSGELASVSAVDGSDLRALALGTGVKGIWTIDAGSGNTTVLVGTGLGLQRLSAPASGAITSTWGPVGSGAVSAPLVAANGKVYVGTTTGTLQAFDLVSGAPAGSATLGDTGTPPTIGTPNRDVSANLLIVGGSDGVVYAVPIF